MKAPRLSLWVCRNSIRPRRSGSSRHCRFKRGGRHETLQSFGLGGQPPRAYSVPGGCAGRCRVLLLRAARPRGRSLLHRQGGERVGDLAGRHRGGNADPGRRPHREEAAGTAVFRKGADLFEADVQSQLPANLLGPVVNDEFSDVDSILYMMTSDGADYAQLKKAAEGMRQRLLKVPGVTKVDLYGTQDERIFVEFSHAKLATLGITPQALFDSLAKQNNVVPAGTVETSSQRVPLRVTGALDGVKAVAETPVESNGRVFRLGDIATVTHGFVDPPTFVARQEGKPALGIGVVTTKGANILELGKEVANATAEFMKAVPQGINVELIADQPKVVEHAVSEFVHSFIEALAIVLFVSFVALGWRTGIVVAASVPLVLAIVFIVMNAMSLDLHRITLGALIIALGLLVDDAIIAVEMMVVKMEQGWDRVRAASFAWESTAFPMLTGTLVTAAGFLPIGFANSAVGEYAGGIFWIVAIALVASWFVAVIFTPYI